MHVTPLLTVTPSVGGPELLEKSTVPNSAASHTHAATAATAAAATAATRRGGRGGASTYSSMNTRDRNTLYHHIKMGLYHI